MSRGVLMAGGALAALGIVLGVAGIFVGASASSKIEALQQSVDALQGKLATIQVSGDPRVGQLQAEQAGIVSRLDEMTARLESETSAAGKGADGRLAELDRRLAALEHKASTSKSAATAPAKTTTGSKTTTTTAKTATVSGGWTVILASYSDKAQSDELRARVQKLGYPAEVLKSLVDGKAVYRVRILGYASHDAAKAAIPGIERKTGISGVWAAQR